MTKYVVSNIELIKKDYLVDAYTKEAAQEKAHLQPPRTKISLGEITHSVTPINEYEYNQKWKPQPDYNEGKDFHTLDPDIGPDQLKDSNLDWVEQASGRDKRHKSEWVHAQEDGRADRLKDDEGYLYPVKDYYDQ